MFTLSKFKLPTFFAPCFFAVSLLPCLTTYGMPAATLDDGLKIEKTEPTANRPTVNVTESYKAGSADILKHFLADHPRIKGGTPGIVEIGRKNEFRVIIPTEGNRNTVVNVNLFITVEKGYVRLTREQKRSQSMISIQQRFVRKTQSEGKWLIELAQEGIQIGENTFVRVTRDPKFRFLEDDEYYFIASRAQLNDANVAAVERVDPVDFIVTPGSDEELRHYGISPPTVADYLPRYVVQADPYYPAYYPKTFRNISDLNKEINEKNEWKWKVFSSSLAQKRKELGLNDEARALRPELYFRYNYAQLAAEDVRSVPYKIGTDEYLRFEWDIQIPTYESIKIVINKPPDYEESFERYARSVSTDNSLSSSLNMLRELLFNRQLHDQARIPDPFYTEYLKAHKYHKEKHTRTVSPSDSDQDYPPKHGTAAELSQYKISLPKMKRPVLLPGVPYNVPVMMADARDGEALTRYNRAVDRYNSAQWRVFTKALKEHGLKKSDYYGKTINGKLIIDISDIDELFRYGQYYVFTNRQSLPKPPSLLYD